MDRQTFYSEILQERYEKVEHPSGLTILIYPMKNFQSTVAMIGTRFGSVNERFKLAGEKQFFQIPAGTAHYLEHQLFESEGKDAFTLFSDMGASANAYTSFNETAYYFSCTDKFEQSLSVLLDFVQNPYFTAETVEKERGIIGQEITMYNDNPEWRTMFSCLQALYQKNPVRQDIAGTIESIAKIDKDILYECYHTFYNLHNMVLVVVGRFEPDNVLDLVDKHLRQDKKPAILLDEDVEPEAVAQKKVMSKMDITVPQFCIGFKLAPKAGLEKMRAELAFEVLFEYLLGNGSALYQDFYQSGLVKGGEVFSEVFSGAGYFSILVSGESSNPDEVYQKICQAVEQAKKEGISQKNFERVRKCLFGKYLASSGSVREVASYLFTNSLLEMNYFDIFQILSDFKVEDILSALSTISTENTSLSVVEPV